MATDMGSVLLGKAAVDCGLINRVGGVSDALEKLYVMIAKKRRRKKRK